MRNCTLCLKHLISAISAVVIMVLLVRQLLASARSYLSNYPVYLSTRASPSLYSLPCIFTAAVTVVVLGIFHRFRSTAIIQQMHGVVKFVC